MPRTADLITVTLWHGAEQQHATVFKQDLNLAPVSKHVPIIASDSTLCGRLHICRPEHFHTSALLNRDSTVHLSLTKHSVCLTYLVLMLKHVAMTVN